jgi:hypothetical protein
VGQLQVDVPNQHRRVGRTNRLIVLFKIGGQKTGGPNDNSECEAPDARPTREKIHQGVLNAADWAVMIGAQAGPQWSFVESFRDEAHLYRGLSRASTTGQWATR